MNRFAITQFQLKILNELNECKNKNIRFSIRNFALNHVFSRQRIYYNLNVLIKKNFVKRVNFGFFDIAESGIKLLRVMSE